MFCDSTPFFRPNYSALTARKPTLAFLLFSPIPSFPTDASSVLSMNFCILCELCSSSETSASRFFRLANASVTQAGHGMQFCDKVSISQKTSGLSYANLSKRMRHTKKRFPKKTLHRLRNFQVEGIGKENYVCFSLYRPF